MYLAPELLLSALAFPPETTLLGARYDPFHNRAELILAHPDLPEINVASPPLVNPMWQLRPGEKLEFVSWGEA